MPAVSALHAPPTRPPRALPAPSRPPPAPPPVAQRSYLPLFSLVESWGASTVFFYIIFSVVTLRWNRVRFNAQIKGLDLRDLSRGQFNHFGRLIDNSFQVPRELLEMAS